MEHVEAIGRCGVLSRACAAVSQVQHGAAGPLGPIKDGGRFFD